MDVGLLNLVVYLAIGFTLPRTSAAASFSFKYHGGLCRAITPVNQEACCTEGPRHPEEDQFRGNLLIGVGPRKSGTTFLYSLLKQSPDLVFPLNEVKETHFFSTGVPINAGRDLVQRNGSLKEYEDFWGSVGPSSTHTYVDMTSDYFRDPGVPCRIKRMAPNAKILITLRDPAWRALSLTSMTRTQCHRDFFKSVNQLNEKYPWICCAVTRSLADLFRLAKLDIDARPGCDFRAGMPEKTWMDCGSRIYDHNPIQVGMYAAIIGWWLEFFPPANILVLESKKIEEDPVREANRILEFVGARAQNLEPDLANHFTGAYKWKDANVEQTIKEMHAYFDSPERELIAFLSLFNKSIQPLREWDNSSLEKSKKASFRLQDSCESCEVTEDECSHRLEYLYGQVNSQPAEKPHGPKHFLVGCIILLLGLLCYKRKNWKVPLKKLGKD